jgi:hypothetical protein
VCLRTGNRVARGPTKPDARADDRLMHTIWTV